MGSGQLNSAVKVLEVLLRPDRQRLRISDEPFDILSGIGHIQRHLITTPESLCCRRRSNRNIVSIRNR